MELTQFYTWACMLLSIILSKIANSNAKPTFYVASPYAGYDSSYGSYSGVSSIERFDRNNDYAVAYGKPLTSERLSRLRRGYYYVDDGYIAPVSNDIVDNTYSGNRRVDASASDSAIASASNSDSDTNLPNGVRFTPLVRYKQTRTKRKKLFVPNLFG